MRTQNIMLAREVYEAAARIPEVSTAAALFSRDGLQLDGPLFEGSSLTYCFRGLRVLLLKSLDEKEAERAAVLRGALHEKLEHVVEFELISRGSKSFMLMPKFEATLEQISWLREPDSVTLLDHISCGLRSLHTLGFSHADVKPANIALQRGAFVLIDVGSVCRFGIGTSSTDAYVPRDFFGDKASRSSAVLDWWMLGMTMAEKCCRSEMECVKIGNSRSLTKEALVNHLQNSLPTALWEKFSFEAAAMME